MYAACCKGHLEVVKFLKSKGASLTQPIKTSDGWTPLHGAFYYWNVSIILYLVEEYPRESLLCQDNSNFKITPIHLYYIMPEKRQTEKEDRDRICNLLNSKLQNCKTTVPNVDEYKEAIMSEANFEQIGPACKAKDFIEYDKSFNPFDDSNPNTANPRRAGATVVIEKKEIAKKDPKKRKIDEITTQEPEKKKLKETEKPDLREIRKANQERYGKIVNNETSLKVQPVNSQQITSIFTNLTRNKQAKTYQYFNNETSPFGQPRKESLFGISSTTQKSEFGTYNNTKSCQNENTFIPEKKEPTEQEHSHKISSDNTKTESKGLLSGCSIM